MFAFISSWLAGGGGHNAAPTRANAAAAVGGRPRAVCSRAPFFGSAVAASAAAAAAPASALSMRIFDAARRAEASKAAASASAPTASTELFTLSNLEPAPGSRHRKKRKGRGISAGQGASCGFGMRGQLSRSGRGPRPGFEGGQTPLNRRLPKLVGRPMGPGHKRTRYRALAVDVLNKCEGGEVVSLKSLVESGRAFKSTKRKLYKVLGDGELTVRNLTVKAHAFSTSAQEKIEAAGGKCVLLNPVTGEDLVLADGDEKETAVQTGGGDA